MIGSFRKRADLLVALVLAVSAVMPPEAHAASVSRMSADEKVVYLTFDDGPDEVNTVGVMNTLMKYDVQGTFFFTGVNMEKYPSVAKQVYDNGFTIGLHSYAHASLAKMSAQGIKNDLGKTNDILQAITGERSAIVRPPYGDTNSSARSTLDSLGYTSYMWTIDPKDWSGSQTDGGALQDIKRNLKPGAIILLHSSPVHPRAARILPELIEYIKAEGYQMKALPDTGYKTVPASKSKLKITVNGGEDTGIGAYLISGNNYIGLRGLAAALSGTSKQFGIGWDADRKAVELVTGGSYGPDTVDAESAIKERARAAVFGGKLIIDGKEAEISTYTIDGSGFYSLTELSAALGIELVFDAAGNSAKIIAPAQQQMDDNRPADMPEWLYGVL